MFTLLNAALALFLIFWIAVGIWLLVRYEVLFGPHPDDPSETPSARSFGVAHVAAVWFGVFALTGYFLFIY